ncbi:MAG: FHA domain-containing protein [Anaerolineales bacterium]|nr:FHA domain-containing protein [Anaerolineales bacterium]
MKNKKKPIHFLAFSLGIVLFFSNISMGKALGNELQDARAALNFCAIENPGVGAFPDVDLSFRAYDQSLIPIESLVAKDIRISENGQPPVQIQDGIQVDSARLGIDFHVIINRGNRTDQSAVKNFLSSLLMYYQEGKDQAYIYTDDASSLNKYFTPNSGKSFTQVVSEYPASKLSSYRVIDAAVRGVLSELVPEKDKCQRPRFLFLVMGDDVITEDNFPEYAKNAALANVKLVVVHIPTEDGSLQRIGSYKNFAEQADGVYLSAVDGNIGPFLSTLSRYRQAYEIKYRSGVGESGQRALAFAYQGVTYPVQGNGTYTIGLLPPQVTVVVPSIVERTAMEVAETGFIYDIKGVNASIQVSFPDQFPRKIETLALIINQPGKPELRVPVSITSSNGDTYNFQWLLGDLGDARQTDVSIRAEVVDDLGVVATSPDISVVVISYKPLLKVVQRYYLYITYGVILLLLVVITLMWRRIKNSAIGQRVTSVVQNVRKTLLGGGQRGKPLAGLRIIDGPPNMINQELKIHTESIKLGRDPQKADMTFYGANVNSSISGLHARIERVNHAWRIVALSASGSETFIDDYPIPFNEPTPLNGGQVIRLGYPAQQPVVFEFVELSQSVRKTESGTRITDIPRATDMPRTTDVSSNNALPNQPARPVSKPQSSGQDDDIFNEYRNR